MLVASSLGILGSIFADRTYMSEVAMTVALLLNTGPILFPASVHASAQEPWWKQACVIKGEE